MMMVITIKIKIKSINMIHFIFMEERAFILTFRF